MAPGNCGVASSTMMPVHSARLLLLPVPAAGASTRVAFNAVTRHLARSQPRIALCCCRCCLLPPRSSLGMPSSSGRKRRRRRRFEVRAESPDSAGGAAATRQSRRANTRMQKQQQEEQERGLELECIGTGTDVECVIPNTDGNIRIGNKIASTKKTNQISPESEEERGLDLECIGTGTDVECVILNTDDNISIGNKLAARAASLKRSREIPLESLTDTPSELAFLVSNAEQQSSPPFLLKGALEYLLLISPFFFWGTAMVAMKGVLPKAGPLFVAATRLIPSGFLLIAFAKYQNRKQPSGLNAWLAISLFALVDAACFQGFLAEGLKRTNAGLGSVIIDSQPLTVAVLASVLFGETIGALGVLGLATGVIGLLLLEVPPQVIEDFFKGHSLVQMAEPNTFSKENGWSIWDSGEWWMLLAAQSMAVGTVMVRWLCQYSDPVMATGWHMVLGGIPLLALASIQHDPALAGHIQDLEIADWLALLYTSVFGSAVSYGVFFYNASRGSLTKLSSLTFLTPMFAALFGYILLNETLNPTQIAGALVTLASIYLINARTSLNDKDDIN